MVHTVFKPAGLVSLLLAAPTSMWGQEVSYHSISEIVEVGTVAVGSSTGAQVLSGTRLATPENISLLANVKTICVLPYNGWQAKTVIEALPSLTALHSGLEADKALRQQRNEVAEELTNKGFQIVDCLAGAEPDGQLIFAKVLGGLEDLDLPTYFWLLYANEKHQITVYGETELLGLARPASGWLPANGKVLAQQVRSAVDAAQTIAERNLKNMKKVIGLADVKRICVSGNDDARSQAIAVSKTIGLQVLDCASATENYDAKLEISDLRAALGLWLFELKPRDGFDLLYHNEAKSVQAGMNDLSAVLKKSD